MRQKKKQLQHSWSLTRTHFSLTKAWQRSKFCIQWVHRLVECPLFTDLQLWFLYSNEANILSISSNQGDPGGNHGHFDSQGNQMTSFAHSIAFNPTFAINGYCESYKGSVCSQYIKNSTIYVTGRHEQSYLESQLTNVLKHVATWRDISPQCHRFAMPLLCFTAFSLCDEYSSESFPRKVSFLSMDLLFFLFLWHDPLLSSGESEWIWAQICFFPS